MPRSSYRRCAPAAGTAMARKRIAKLQRIAKLHRKRVEDMDSECSVARFLALASSLGESEDEPDECIDCPEAADDCFEETDDGCFKRVSVKNNGKWRPVYTWWSGSDGVIKGGCHNTCTNQFVDFDNFAPTAGSSQTQAKRTKFDAAYLAYKAAHAAGDHHECVAQRTTLVQLRITRCFKCRQKPGYLSKKQRECKEWYDAKRKDAALRNDGCANLGCPALGPDAWCILCAEHGTNPKKKDAKGYVVQLSDYARWPSLGGVPAMEEEAKQVKKWTCKCCGRLDPSSSSANRGGDPVHMPDGKPKGTEAERKQYARKRHVVRVRPKQEYVDKHKRGELGNSKGECSECKRRVLKGQEVAFDWHHRDEATKCVGGLFGDYGGVSGLVRNDADAATLDKVQHLLDAEMEPKCDLVCCNCHHRLTWNYPLSATVF